MMAALNGQNDISIGNLIITAGILDAAVLIHPVSAAGFNEIHFITMLIFAFMLLLFA
ncbi:K+-dependent Na+/Ca+ exchanger related-protein [Psychromonas ingrahamii 37]|uniref:K+-dependent Na+/Ca+ exchanger related-protein n=1 Tax=Psychromonas ingrahamii (strain DSM 17664 / CCUG 51855 / 37) TaxID=357804 RepID=A1SV22_PSYIN|nr:K+-dependent Na+/Ca+ exchanger related-protein [Psychromonas ingrahamii 37]